MHRFQAPFDSQSSDTDSFFEMAMVQGFKHPGGSSRFMGSLRSIGHNMYSCFFSKSYPFHSSTKSILRFLPSLVPLRA